MKIDAYGGRMPITSIPARPAAGSAKPEGTAEPSAHEKLRMLLDEKRHLADAAFRDATPESALGQNIDLRA